jgi:uncharacterized membrane protein
VILVRYLASTLLPGLLVGLSLVAAEEKKSDPAAEKMIKEAHQARADWDAAFPGFTCKLTAVVDGKQATGKLIVGADHNVRVELPEGPVADWATPQLESLVAHRFAANRERYDVVFADDELHHPLGRLIKFSGTSNVYRINGDVITEVHRSTGKGKFTISMTEVVRNAEGKYLPRSFNVSYWDADGNLRTNEDYLEEYTRVGKLDLPKRRIQIKTGKNERTVSELRMSDYEVTPAAARK